ncbi:hypothetical protein HNP55_003613 [Paucibacter oligotrophus]|uniref:Uncharacterized protein n=1 Tax=Roseateles oligotrophus TaxID=1769250 RepID=A0A840LIH2_9BURK|nr:hypothetical protein [Roseateles oligotrophus]MBB4845067.1 hypothetical protein [Roseateles oligotrophus]
MHRPLPSTRAQQRGVSTLLFILLTGLSLGGMVFGAISYVRGLQSQSTTVHALTQAQLKAWNGAEVLRQYLLQVNANDLSKLALNSPATFTGLDDVTATLSQAPSDDALNCPGGKMLAFDIVGSSAGASALLATSYCVKPGKAHNPGPKAAINIKGDLGLGGNIEVVGGDGRARVVVDGKVTGGGSISGIEFLYAKGAIELQGSTSNGTLFSESSIALSGSGDYNKLQAMGDIKLSGGVSVKASYSNAATSLSSNTVIDLKSIGPVTLAGAARVTNLMTKAYVDHKGAEISGNAQVQGDYQKNGWGSVASGNYGGALTGTGGAMVNMTRSPGLQVNLPLLTAETITAPTFDAYPYKAVANYVFERVNGATKVSVRSVTGIPDGAYFLVGEGSNQDYLCKSNSYNANSCVAKICTGSSANNSCFAYDNGSNTWSISSNISDGAMAPGVLWFDGNLVAGNGVYYNSWIATGNISTQGNHRSYAVNFADYARICNGSRYARTLPSNFCVPGQATLKPQSVGNICLGSGGLLNGSFRGGKISLGANVEVFGDVLAGDVLESSGSTVIHGYIAAADLGTYIGGSKLGASTRLDMNNLPASYTPGGGQDIHIPAAVTLLWSRYR